MARSILRALLALVLAAPVLAAGIGLGWRLASVEWHVQPLWPAVLRSAALSLQVGLVATLISCVIVFLAFAALDFRRGLPAWFTRLLAPLLAVPHAAAAIGLAFLLAPTGWLNRWLATAGLLRSTPSPDYLFPHDPAGLSLILGLVLKEVPFLFLMVLSAMPRAEPSARMQAAQGMGYGRVAAFLLTVFPAVYPLVRLPVLAVLAYGMSGVDMALVLGPGLPPVLAVQILSWWSESGMRGEALALAGGVALTLIAAFGFLVWIALERCVAFGLRLWAFSGRRAVMLDRPLAWLAGLLLLAVVLALGFSVVALIVWSFAGPWSWPAPLPAFWTVRHWTGSLPQVLPTISLTLAIAALSSLLAILLSLAVLESSPHRPVMAEKIIWLPLLLPQIALLPGIHVALIHLSLDGHPAAVVAAHTPFVLPYVHLCLAGPFRSINPRWLQTASSLGLPPRRVFFEVRLPLLLTSLVLAFAVGMAVSIAQYLPTLMIGGGRVRTITTETLALASGMNRRTVGVYASLQALLPCLIFAVALLSPSMIWRNRKAMRNG